MASGGEKERHMRLKMESKGRGNFLIEKRERYLAGTIPLTPKEGGGKKMWTPKREKHLHQVVSGKRLGR